MRNYARLGIVADTHVGSVWGLCPMDADGGIDLPGKNTGRYFLSERQKTMLAQYQESIRRCPPLDDLVLNADLIDGEDPKERGVYQVSTSLEWQRTHAEQLLEPLVRKAKRVHITEGTPYHNVPDGMAMFAEVLGAEDGVEPMVVLRYGDVVIQIAHKHASAMNTGGALWSKLQKERWGARAKGYDADVVVASHVHHYGLYENSRQISLVTPCWKLQGIYELTNDKADLWIPDLGMVVLTIYPGARAKGLRPVVVEPMLYPHPLRDVKDLWEEMDGKKSDN